jgi:hypothetical protein
MVTYVFARIWRELALTQILSLYNNNHQSRADMVPLSHVQQTIVKPSTQKAGTKRSLDRPINHTHHLWSINIGSQFTELISKSEPPQMKSQKRNLFFNSPAYAKANQRKGECAAAPWQKIPAPEGLEPVTVGLPTTGSEFSSLPAR